MAHSPLGVLFPLYHRDISALDGTLRCAKNRHAKRKNESNAGWRAAEEPIYDFGHLVHFVEAARSDSFTEAAARLRVSTAAISRSIARLEQDVGVKLFNRTTRRLNLTEDGALFLSEVTASLEKLAAAKDMLRDLHGQASGTLKVSLVNGFCKHYVMPHLPAFLAAYPALSLDLHIGDYGIDLLAGGFELAVRYGQPLESGYIHRMLGGMNVVLIASPAYLAVRGTPRVPADLALHECVNMRDATGSAAFTWNLQRRDGTGGIVKHQPQGRCFVNTQLDTVIHAAVHGVGIAPCDLGAARRGLEDGSLKIVLPDYHLVQNGELCLLYPHREFMPKKLRVFIDFLIDVAQEELPVPNFNPYLFAA